MQEGAQGNQVVREILTLVEAHVRGMWRYRWRAMVLAWMLFIAGWLAISMIPPVYQASARIYVDTENAIAPLLRGIAPTSNVLNEVTIVTREMLSRPNLAEVARATDLDLRADDEGEFEDLLADLQRRIVVSGNRDNIFSIRFQDRSRSKAVAVVDSLVNTFVEQSLGANRTESSQAQTFLQEQINEYEARLTASEDRLAKFKRDNVEFMPDQRGDYFARLQAAETAVESTRSRLRLAQERRSELMRQIEGEEPVFGIMPTETPSGGSGYSASKIRELENQLEELRLQYTDKHPQITRILETIDLLRKQQSDEQQAASSAGRGPGVSSPLETNPVYQNMRIQLTNTEVEIASLRAELGQQQMESQRLKTLVDTVPQVEAELGRLNRDYDVVKAKYEQLLTQLESANLGEDVEESIDEVQFRIIDPPFAGLVPSGPKRHLLLSGLLIASLGAALVLTFLLNQVHPVFFTGRAVTSATGLPVLGSVRLFLNKDEKRKKRRSHRRFVLALAAFFAMFVVTFATVDYVSPVLRDMSGMES